VRTAVTADDVAGFYAGQDFDLAGAYACLLVDSGHQVWMPEPVLRAAAARVLSAALNALHESLALCRQPLGLFDRLADPVRFAWACLRRHVARMACSTLSGA
jgi:hypothetical protein